MKETIVTYCAKNKRMDTKPLPAWERYLSDRIKNVYSRAKAENRPMLILSGLLGLIRPETPIMWYNKLLMPEDVGGMVDLVAHHLLGFKVQAVEYVTKDIWTKPQRKPYQDLMAAACKRQKIEMEVKIID